MLSYSLNQIMSLLRTLSGSRLPLSAVPRRLGLQPDHDLRCSPLTLADITVATLAPAAPRMFQTRSHLRTFTLAAPAACVSTSPGLHRLLWDFIQMLPSLVVAQKVKNLPAMQVTRLGSLNQEDPLEEGMATHSRVLAWRIPWAEEPGRLQSIESQRIRYN